VTNEQKNKIVEEHLKLLDWLGIELDFNKKYQNKVFESQRAKDYFNWMKLLIGQKEAYKCFCKSYTKCEKHCGNSSENYNIDDFSNPHLTYVRFKNQNLHYEYYDYLKSKDEKFNSEDLGDFVIYKAYNQQFLDSFKKVVDQNIFEVTHVLENKVKIYYFNII
jgi:glutamyl/glutaminyl-tRNA synthetase